MSLLLLKTVFALFGQKGTTQQTQILNSKVTKNLVTK